MPDPAATQWQQASTFAEADAEFMSAWRDSRYTAIEREPVDVNSILRERYQLTSEVSFTRTMLWDVEVKKAHDPARYIPTPVLEGWTWAEHRAGHEDRFLRASRQRQWLTREVGLVLERVHLNHDQQRVIFLGTAELRDAEGRTLRAEQPLFHVEHGVQGPEREPLNTWRIVHLTNRRDERLLGSIGPPRTRLPEYVELYIKHDLGLDAALR